MEINQASIKAYEIILNDPKSQGFDFPPLKECFEECREPTAAHILFEKFLAIIDKPLPKVVFYIIMDKTYQKGKAKDGNLGYMVRIKPGLKK